MKIDFLHIKSRFKNLENIKVNFDENHLMTVLIGGNGSGKSNVLEALVSIFRNLDLGEKPDFAYEVKYKLGGGNNAKWVTVIADPTGKTLSQQYQITFSRSITGANQKIALSKVKRDKKGHSDFLPNHVFAYYSGPSDRLEKYFKKHRTNFYRKLLKSEVDLKSDIRPLFYAKPFHSQFVLLAFFLSKQADQEKEFLKTHLGIESLDSVHFVMRKPSWTQSKNKKELFWGAEGVVRDFLELLYPHCLAPVKITRSEDTGLTGSDIKNEFFHLFLPSVDVLREFAEGLTPDVFFKMLESTLLSEIISEVSVRVKVSSSEQPLSFSELSEGEQQLLTVLGLLKFTGGKDTLFLLDEPDTHLNPAWTVKYLNFLDQFVPYSGASHLLMVSHHPLAIAELEKEQVQVMERSGKDVIAFQPMESPKGMGINFLLRSDMFGLKTTIDQPTTEDIEARNKLAGKPTSLTLAEKQELQRLNDRLEPLGFNISTDDPDYMDYLMKKYHPTKGDVS
ncbi:MAG: chromosome segregation protein SMC [Robiginitomaculum sp.]|nr:MAG: chromosome segregation protein SMC [Robiginitomaculum sp.]